MTAQRVVILGAGIVGLCTAWTLLRDGHEVFLVDRGLVAGGATPGNAGWVCPSQVAPLAEPGMVRRAATMLLRPTSPLYIAPRADRELLRFLLAFTRRCTSRAHANAVAALVSLAREVEADYLELETGLAAVGASVPRARVGVLCCFTDPATARRAHAQWQRPERLGSPGPGPLLDGAAVRGEEPALGEAVQAGYLLPADSYLDPAVLAAAVRQAVLAAGATLVEHAGNCELLRSGNRVTGVRTATAGDISADEVVVSAGAASARYLHQLGVRVPLVHGTGYSFTVHPELMPARPLLLEEAHVACTPLARGLRVAGTMALSSRPSALDERRVEAITRSARDYLEGVDWNQRRDIWVAPRPVTADGLPVLGRPRGVMGCIVATGHGMYGVTLAPTTARFVAGVLRGGSVPPTLAPERGASALRQGAR